MDFLLNNGMDSPALNNAVANLKLDFNDLNLDFNLEESRANSRESRFSHMTPEYDQVW